MAMKSTNPVIIKNEQGQFQLIDDPNHTLETLPAKRALQVLALLILKKESLKLT